MKVDNMHYSLYKKLRPRQEEGARLAAFWTRRERLKRKLDADMSAARAELAALPSHIPLLHELLSHLNALIATPSTCLHTAADSQHISYASYYASGYLHTCSGAPKPSPQLIASAFGAHPSSGAAHTEHSLPDFNVGLHGPAIHNFRPRNLSSGSPLPRTCDSEFVQDPLLSDMHTSYRSGTVSQYPSCTLLDHRHGDQPSHNPEGLRFMGQHAKDMMRAERVLQGLRYVMEATKDLHVDVLNAEMPGVLLEVEKCHKLWSDLLLTQKMAPDFVEVCQIAAIQQNRCSLFQDPFPYSFQQRRI